MNSRFDQRNPVVEAEIDHEGLMVAVRVLQLYLPNFDLERLLPKTCHPCTPLQLLQAVCLPFGHRVTL